jgi:hypothetical protein
MLGLRCYLQYLNAQAIREARGVMRVLTVSNLTFLAMLQRILPRASAARRKLSLSYYWVISFF